MKAKNKIDLLESLMAELKPSDYEMLDKQNVPANFWIAIRAIKKLDTEFFRYNGGYNTENICDFCILYSFQLGHIIGKREERLKHKIHNTHVGTI